MIMPMSDMTSPAIARPRGRLKMPINENINPNIHKVKSSTGIQHKRRARSARMKPAVPSPLEDFSGACCIMTDWCPDETLAGGIWAAPLTFCPHLGQKAVPSANGLPQLEQNLFSIELKVLKVMVSQFQTYLFAL